MVTISISISGAVMTFSVWSLLFGATAVVASLIIGSSARHIFWDKKYRDEYFQLHGWYGIVYQFWFNLIGSLVGWISLAVFLGVFFQLEAERNLSAVTVTHLLFLIIGGMGVSGLIPQVFMVIAGSAGELFRWFVDLVTKSQK